MATSTKNAQAAILNLPNQLTVLRIALAVVLFALIAWRWYLVSFVLFIVAAGTDWLDGYLARKYGMVTTLGRILDPFADKVIICGTFIFLVAVPYTNVRLHELGLQAWVVVLVVGRELLITALRSYLEERGADFSATTSGKLKMVAQCVTAATGLFYLSYFSDAAPTTTAIE